MENYHVDLLQINLIFLSYYRYFPLQETNTWWQGKDFDKVWQRF